MSCQPFAPFFTENTLLITRPTCRVRLSQLSVIGGTAMEIAVLLMLQSVIVGTIAVLSGREANLDSTRDFIFSLGGVGGSGLGFRLLTQQSSKLLNSIFPGAGSVISTTVAASGTKAIGTAAISYYLKELR